MSSSSSSNRGSLPRKLVGKGVAPTVKLDVGRYRQLRQQALQRHHVGRVINAVALDLWRNAPTRNASTGQGAAIAVLLGTEFTDPLQPDLLSVGLVSLDGVECYGELDRR